MAREELSCYNGQSAWRGMIVYPQTLISGGCSTEHGPLVEPVTLELV